MIQSELLYMYIIQVPIVSEWGTETKTPRAK